MRFLTATSHILLCMYLEVAAYENDDLLKKISRLVSSHFFDIHNNASLVLRFRKWSGNSIRVFFSSNSFRCKKMKFYRVERLWRICFIWLNVENKMRCQWCGAKSISYNIDNANVFDDAHFSHSKSFFFLIRSLNCFLRVTGDRFIVFQIENRNQKSVKFNRNWVVIAVSTFRSSF